MAPSGKVFAVLIIAVVGLLVAYTVYESSNSPGSVTSPVPSRFTVDGRTYQFTYVATTQAERQAGLMNREITNSTTMLFAFPHFSTWSFWMYDTNTSLDMIWVNATGNSGRVVYVVTSAQPCFNTGGLGCATYTPAEKANYVIEAKAGFAESNGIVYGSTITFG